MRDGSIGRAASMVALCASVLGACGSDAHLRDGATDAPRAHDVVANTDGPGEMDAPTTGDDVVGSDAPASDAPASDATASDATASDATASDATVGVDAPRPRDGATDAATPTDGGGGGSSPMLGGCPVFPANHIF